MAAGDAGKTKSYQIRGEQRAAVISRQRGTIWVSGIARN